VNLGRAAQHLGEALAQGRKMMFVDPVHEKRVRNFEFDALRSDFARGDRFEPGLERLIAFDSALHRHQDLSPDVKDVPRGLG